MKIIRRKVTFISGIPKDFKKRELFLILLMTQGCYWGIRDYAVIGHPLLNESVWMIWRSANDGGYLGRIEKLYSERKGWAGWHIHDITYERAIEVITRKLKWGKNEETGLDDLEHS